MIAMSIMNLVLFGLSVVNPVFVVGANIISFLFFMLMIFGIIHVVNGVKKPLPLIGRVFEKKFEFIDK